MTVDIIYIIYIYMDIFSFADMSPAMIEGFDEKFVTPGDTFELRCKAKGSPLPEVFWRIDGDHLYKSERHKISSRQNIHETEAVLQVKSDESLL